ncbi:MAG: SUMF1/EgtB/PvdO family nonheme iron enzyme [Sorangiineae bacterium]|nr:SUMF1/EgtB/PvdO family nonheme iron enzyme [Polyangiaceae bacterium]MEB2322851.1 SUMF1/EgtB/PvdO family nonheme iron enzyme [Sorangiineae bacterium]
MRSFEAHALAALALFSSVAGGAGCKRDAPRPAGGAPPATSSAVAPSASAGSMDAGAAADAGAAPDAASGDSGAEASATLGSREGCPDGMLRVEGEYCPAVIQECLEEHPEYLARKGDPTVSERCLKYKEPTRCVSKERTHLAFCMDLHEYPNRVGELPWVLVSFTQARERCKAEGKRLCTEDEFNFACEGPDMRPYATGFVREPEACNLDKPYVFPDHSRRMLWYESCQKNERCAAELKRLDQRLPIGARDTCVSWAGLIDLNGNVNEWVDLPGKEYPNRSGLKGGWWGPVRSRCRPTVTFHKENDYGYEAGFRCCKDVSSNGDAAAPGEARDAADGGAPGRPGPAVAPGSSEAGARE